MTVGRGDDNGHLEEEVTAVEEPRREQEQASGEMTAVEGQSATGEKKDA